MRFYSLLTLLNLLFLISFEHSQLANAFYINLNKPVISFCSGGHYSCALFDDRQLACAGIASFIEVSSYDKGRRFNGGYRSVELDSSYSIDKITCSGSGICMLLNTSDIKCTGSNEYGQTGIGSSDSYLYSTKYHGDTLPIVNLGNGVKVIDIMNGFAFACVLTTERKVKCFGMNNMGQLGLEDTRNRGMLTSDMGENLPYVDFGAGVEAASIHSSAHAEHSCVILSKPESSSQRFKCWGNGIYFQLGYRNNKHRGVSSGDMGDNLPLVDLGFESRVKQLALGWLHTCALLIDENLKCFGGVYVSRVWMDPLRSISTARAMIPSILTEYEHKIKLIEAGRLFTCVVYEDLITVKCFEPDGSLSEYDRFPLVNLALIPQTETGPRKTKIKSIHIGNYVNDVLLENNMLWRFKRFDFKSTAAPYTMLQTYTYPTRTETPTTNTTTFENQVIVFIDLMESIPFIVAIVMLIVFFVSVAGFCIYMNNADHPLTTTAKTIETTEAETSTKTTENAA